MHKTRLTLTPTEYNRPDFKLTDINLRVRITFVLNLETYIASKEDIETIEEAIKYVWNPKLDFIFNDKSEINDTAVISYDSRYVYIWMRDNGFIKIPHKIKILEKFHSYWRAGLEPGEIEKYLPAAIREKTRFEIPILSGGLVTPFIELQKLMKKPNNPYTTKESYFAAIVHEFGHIYYDQHKLTWYSDKKKNLSLMKLAFKLYGSKKIQPQKYPILYTNQPFNFTEVFAFCAEYTAADFFWKGHKKVIDEYSKLWIKKLIKEEQELDLDKKNSSIEISAVERAHSSAIVLGKILFEEDHKVWPGKLLRRKYIT